TSCNVIRIDAINGDVALVRSGASYRADAVHVASTDVVTYYARLKADQRRRVVAQLDRQFADLPFTDHIAYAGVGAVQRSFTGGRCDLDSFGYLPGLQLRVLCFR